MKNKLKKSNVVKFNPNPSREEAMNAVKTLIEHGLETIITERV